MRDPSASSGGRLAYADLEDAMTFGGRGRPPSW